MKWMMLCMFLGAGSVATDGGSTTPGTTYSEPEDVGRLLRCPVCQGMPISESPSEMAQAMMKRVRELHAEGQSDQAIQQYFVDRYGEWVLLEPKKEGFNRLIWLLPWGVLLLGAIGIGAWFRQRRKSASADRVASDESVSPQGAASSDYASKLEEQL